MFSYGDLLGNTIDVQGFSHRNRDAVDKCHAEEPTKPIWMSECCSCNTMRGEDVSDGGIQRSFNGDCQQGQTNNSDGVPYAIGQMVWTLHDYYGEPSNGGWPYVSSTFGAFDLAGFPKAAAHWFRANWLYRVADGSPEKTFDTGRSHEVHVVESWAAPPPPHTYPSENRSYVTSCGGGGNQHIVFGGTGTAAGVIKNHDGLCLDARCVYNTTSYCYPLPFAACDGASTQQWMHVDGHIASVGTAGKCLDVEGGYGPKVGLWGCKGGNDPNDNQHFNISADGILYRGYLCLSDTSSGGGVGYSREMHVYTSADSVELFVNGVSQGRQHVASVMATRSGRQPTVAQTYAEFAAVRWEAGNVTATAYDAAGKAVAQHVVHTAGAAVALRLSVDCPSPATGTGTALLLDGHDAALVRAEVVDAEGHVVHGAAHNITFAATSGPGRISGTHAGDPRAAEQPSTAPWRAAYHGLARAVVAVTHDAATSAWHRARLLHIDVDAGARTTIADPHLPGAAAAAAITVSATAPGLAAAAVSIPLSTDAARDSVLSAAERYGSAPVSFD